MSDLDSKRRPHAPEELLVARRPANESVAERAGAASGESEAATAERGSDASSEAEGAARPSDADAALAASAADPAQCDAIWTLLRAAIRERVQPEQFETWFRRAKVASLDDRAICIAVQNGFSRDWLRNYYQEVIEDAVQHVLERALTLTFQVDPELVAAPAGDPAEEAPATEEPATPLAQDAPPAARASAPPPRRNSSEFTSDGLVRGSDIGLNPKYTFGNFVVGPCNRFSHAVSMGTAEAPGKAYNPLFLHGNVGLGKTHLLQSICASLLETYRDIRILFLSCETFVNHFISALENGDLQKFRTKYRNVDVLVVDDIHLLANKERTQEEFFHTFNSLYNAGKQIVLSSDSPPKDIPTLQDRLVSRFKWGLVTEIEPPCYETRMAILKRKGRERGEELPDEVAQIIAERIDSNIRELEGAVNRLYSFANVSNQRISTEFAREVLGELFVQRRGQPTMDDIIQTVTAHFSVKLSDLQSKKRTNQVAYPRQIAMFLARKITRHSLEEIGGFFGGRDHSTVLHGVKKITTLMERDASTRELLSTFLEELQGR
ncbi:MAG: chromosomal replication initiator protein DnaA [Planctomycetes bacterium]|nr:chromosomal replication initiator protein DnaA [Planctomycetota bacterium]